MRPKNFPAAKLIRQLKAQSKDIDSPESKRLISEARLVRTKKRRTP